MRTATRPTHAPRGALALAVLASLLLVGLGQPAGARADALFGSTIHREPATEPWPDAIAHQDAMFGPERVLRIFFAGAPQPWTAPELSHGRPVVVSFKLAPKDVLAGRYDATMRQWFATAPRNHPVWWVYWHEPEDDIRDGRFTAADYRAAFARLDALADQAANPMLRTTQVLMDWTLDVHSGRNWRTYYPGARVIDVQAWDQYGYVNPTTCAYQSMSSHEALRPAYEVTRAEGNDYAIAEIGSRYCIAQRPAWLRDIGAWARGRAAFVTYFHATVGGDYLLSDRASQEAWRSVINASSPPADTTAPVFLSGPSIAPRAFRAARGARLRFGLSEDARVSVEIRRRVAGGRWVLVGRFSRMARQGRNAIAIRGRAGGWLRRGRHRAVIVATDRHANVGAPARVSFRVLRPR
jgi:hypothetical protein